MSDKNKLYEEKVIKYQGARHYLIKLEGEDHFKHHRWDATAIVPIKKDSPWKKSYYLGGIEYTQAEFDEIMREREGLPWYKQAGGKTNRF